MGCLLAGACTAADDDTATPGSSAPAETTVADAPSDDSTAPTDAAAADSTVATTIEPTGEPGRGVTDDTIKLGVMYLDLDKLKDVLPNLNHGDYQSAFEAVATSINDAGGINGRRLELVFGPIDALDMSQAVNQCTRLIEDEQVFAIIAAGSTAESTQCALVDNATPMVGGTQTPGALAAAAAPWFTPVSGSATSTRKLVKVLIDRGTLEGRKLAIVAGAADKEVAEEAKATLEAAGVEVTTLAVASDFGGDQAAARAELQTFLGRMRSDGADTVLPVNEAVVLTYQEIAQTDWRPKLLTGNINAFLGYLVGGNSDTSILEGMFGTGSPLESAAFTEAPAQDCVDRVLAVEPGRDILPPDGFAAGTPDTFVSVVVACQHLDLFAAIAATAGPVLNNDTFRAAGESLGEIELPMRGGPSNFTPETLDGDPPAFVATWDPATNSLARESTPAA